MVGSSCRSAFLTFCVTLLVCSSEVHAGSCLACSYTYAGDGTRDYECVSNPYSFVQTITIPCNFDTHSCTIRTVYSYSGNGQIQSLSRSCLQSTGRDFHCTTTTPTSCELECRTDFCNNGHGNILGTSTVHPGLCLACSYTYAGDGTRDYECVSNPDSYVQSTTIPCNFDTHSCTIRTVYSNSGNNQIQSLSRSCLQSTGRDFHCTTTTPTTCELECRTDLCNNRHGNILDTSTVHAGLCIACSYTYAGDGTRDYECVVNPDSYVQSTTIPCNFDTHSCTIRTVYSYSGIKQIQSLNRSCLQSTGRDFHCTTTTPTTCKLECRTDLCNTRHGDILGTNTADSITTIKYAYKTKYILFYLCTAIAYFRI